MDMYNRYQSGASGEAGHQPRVIAEALTFGVMDLLKETNSLPANWLSFDESAKNKFMENLRDHLQRAYENYGR